ncbi:hypothetical protein BDZ90DRAFT_21149 [Jaminaea rosea]|uniref:Uncharacterized protein n=1 Tax=Jaminaea rosea TaxID=1569628 RepID=A0A316UZH1_9BASI|nr:hypothetical protein BDZ90DRAFT_21149 [Jaminaea rosea]PWN30700.1 hypothetical protein BDZ90DRAFT_21149 [Jaminaea rosea]
MARGKQVVWVLPYIEWCDRSLAPREVTAQGQPTIATCKPRARGWARYCRTTGPHSRIITLHQLGRLLANSQNG